MSLVSIWVAGLLAFHGVFVSQVLDHRSASTQFFVSSAAVVLLQLLAKAADKRSVVLIRTFLYALCLISSASLMAVAVSNMSAIELPLVVALIGIATAWRVRRVRVASLVIAIVGGIPASIVVVFEWFMKP